MTSKSADLGNLWARREVFVLVLGLLFPSWITYLFFVQLADWPAGVQQLVGGGLKTVQFLLPAFWIGWILRQPLRWQRSARGWLMAVLFGGLVAAVLISSYRPILTRLGVLAILKEAVSGKIHELGLATRPRYIALSLFYTLAHSLLEEYYWRWFIFGRLRLYVGVPLAVVISAVGFTLHHIIVLGRFFGYGSLATWICAGGVGVGGAAWAVLYQRAGGLLGPWMSHALVDAAIFWIGYQICFA